MLGLFYLILAVFIGYNILQKTLPGLWQVSSIKSLYGKPIKLNSWMVTLPSSFLVGTLLVTWFTYITAYIASHFSKQPLLLGNLATFVFFTVIAAYILVSKRKGYIENLKRLKLPQLLQFYSGNRLELGFILAILLFWSYFVFRSFFIKDGVINIGISVFSDFAPHLAIIRSFSLGSNFPTGYPHFADGTIRYHFMFLFLSGNLEFLGLRLDWAFNLPSILSMLAFLMLLYSLAVILTGKRAVGLLTVFLFFFRSSFAFFTYLYDMKGKTVLQILSAIITNSGHIGKTVHEEWGLWTQKVYVNQRHLAFALGILIFILIAVYPIFKKMIVKLKRIKPHIMGDVQKPAANQPLNPDDVQEPAVNQPLNPDDALEPAVNQPLNPDDALEPAVSQPLNMDDLQQPAVNKTHFAGYIKEWFSEFLLKKDSWLPESLIRPTMLGIILGLLGFWNGAVVIAALPVLFFIAIFSKRRLEYLNIALITILLVFMQSIFFTGGSAVEPRITVGFLAQSGDLGSILKYYIELLGLLPFILAAALLVLPKGGRWLTLAFFTPIVLATTIQLTPDITVNHKYVILSVILLNIILADFLSRLKKLKNLLSLTAALVLFMAAVFLGFVPVAVSVNKYAIAVVILLAITAANIIYTFKGMRKPLATITAVVLAGLLSITGFADIITQYNMDKGDIRIKTDDPILVWTVKNTRPDEVFLTPMYGLHPILLAGRKVFYGWPYYSWSAGYDTGTRQIIVKNIYECVDLQEVKKLIKENNISYIVIDDDVRNSKDYTLNEQKIKDNFKQVYDDPANRFAIYKT